MRCLQNKMDKNFWEHLHNKQKAVLADMLDCIGKSSAVFKSQQIDDPDLTEAEKRSHAEAVLFENPVAFLDRFGSFLNENHLNLFECFKNETNNYDIDYYLSHLKAVLKDDSKKTLVRNRRFEALKRLENEGKYFSETEMEKREPLLYHQLVGQYLSEREKRLRLKETTKEIVPTFSNYLLQQAEKDALAELRQRQEQDEADQGASSDEDFEPKKMKVKKWGADWEDEESEKRQTRVKVKKPVKITDEEKALLLEEFKTHLHAKFLDGLDVDFDYGTVDCNPEYDCLFVRSQDEEDKYFDDETVSGVLCTDTGIDDY